MFLINTERIGALDKHKQKMIAPIVITAVFVIYLAGYLYLILTVTDFSPVILLYAIPLIVIGIGMIVTLKSRIQEIRSGEEDDLDNY